MSLNFNMAINERRPEKKKTKKTRINASEADALVSDVLVSSIQREMGPQINLPI